MNSNMNFDPMTGEPIQNIQPATPVDNQPVPSQENAQVVSESPAVEPNGQALNATAKEVAQIQNELQNIPTVEQDKEAFINNVQTIHQEKQEEKKEGVNFAFIIILFIIILVAIYFLFPILLKYI